MAKHIGLVEKDGWLEPYEDAMRFGKSLSSLKTARKLFRTSRADIFISACTRRATVGFFANGHPMRRTFG